MKININLGKHRNKKITELPHTIENKGSTFLGVFFIAFSCVWGGVPTFIFLKELIDGTFEPDKLFLLIFTTIGIGIFLIGLSQFFSKRKWHISKDKVEYDQKGLFKNLKWIEPLSNYQGILSTTERRSSGGKNSSSYTVYVLRLYHEENKKSILLYENRSKDGIRQCWEDYARLFSLPCLEQEEKEIIKRDIADLDKSVKELIQEKKIDVDFDPAFITPEGLEFDRGDDVEWVITQTAKQLKVLWFLPILIGLPGVFIYLGFFGEAPILFGVVGAGFLALIVYVLIWETITSPRVYLNAQGIRLCRLAPWGETKGKKLSADHIESIGFKKGDNVYRHIEISTDERHIKVGMGLSSEALTWLKNCMLYKLSK